MPLIIFGTLISKIILWLDFVLDIIHYIFFCAYCSLLNMFVTFMDISVCSYILLLFLYSI